ncbi:uncharacterized protein LOC133441835 isoform X3 [Cololabis saira]|uniref:uncharacterized protein LOC133441835 isoform X3 n=1 Tax=Cololabis saira TaxID=129043 RepID=UPI002AD297B5|nr:uncharacterized protein LOC133441835 isoform X3 [Cololabis saira]
MSRVDSLVHQHPHMHQQDQQRAFTSTLHHPSPILPAAVTRAQDRNVNTHPPRGSGACFSALRPLQSTTQRSSRPVRHRRWAAQHVCIAWRIYYHKQFETLHVDSGHMKTLMAVVKLETWQ